ncbi:mitotic-spindle disanchored Msd1 [Schizosaccharomyces japonicus yFS275]|uniref:Mitotic-spindle disanchored Msd1 n=1 Tax=Schizosaccharomyces japonicus (strain yFS275 / FY16936) TaxID=402676 RepID=B6K3D2_SCHJY|nr:mitotic-spindle disanchored Msd1 [Schizosaccharomyces japonicus yFS275]EEB07989.1 mitotic-spindle disanchored Msd1 [Schizosaccharomyces japonicus yFS275]
MGLLKKYCDARNIPESISYMNQALRAKDLLGKETLRFSGNTDDVCLSINIMYTLLRQASSEFEEKETLLSVLKQKELQISAQSNTIAKLELRLKTAQEELNVSREKCSQQTRENLRLREKNKSLTTLLEKSNTTLQAAKNQLSVALRRREQQMESLKGNYSSVQRRKEKKMVSMMSVKSQDKPYPYPPVLPHAMNEDEDDNDNTTPESLQLQQESISALSSVAESLTRQNTHLYQCIEEAVAELDRLLQPAILARRLQLCVQQQTKNAAVLDAKLHKRIALVRELLTEEKYVSIDEVTPLQEELRLQLSDITKLKTENEQLRHTLTQLSTAEVTNTKLHDAILNTPKPKLDASPIRIITPSNVLSLRHLTEPTNCKVEPTD